jgi:hypothetical protein
MGSFTFFFFPDATDMRKYSATLGNQAGSLSLVAAPLQLVTHSDEASTKFVITAQRAALPMPIGGLAITSSAGATHQRACMQ